MDQPKIFTTTFRITGPQTAWLSTSASKILNHSGAHLTRSEILRGVLDGLAAGHLDLTTCASETEIKRAVAAQLRANGQKGK
jgi:hypothetical protein